MGKRKAYTYLQMEPCSLGPELQPIWLHLHCTSREGNTETRRERGTELGCGRGKGKWEGPLFFFFTLLISGVSANMHVPCDRGPTCWICVCQYVCACWSREGLKVSEVWTLRVNLTVCQHYPDRSDISNILLISTFGTQGFNTFMSVSSV